MNLHEEVYQIGIDEDIPELILDDILRLCEKRALEAVKYKEVNPNAGDQQCVTQHYLNGWMHSQGSAVQAIERIFNSGEK